MSFGNTDGFNSFTPLGGPIQLPGRDGNVYEPPPISYEQGIKLKLYQEQIAEVQQIVFDNIQAARTAEQAGEEPPAKKPVPDYEWSEDDGPTAENMLGKDLIAQMKANNEPFQMIQVATETVWMDFLYGREVAEEFWNSGGDPKVVGQMLWGSGKDHKMPLISTNTGGANTTKPRASTSGTKSRKKPVPKSKPTTKSTPKTKTE